MDSVLMDSGEEKLRKFGYAQQFIREFTLLTNFSVSFSVMSVITGVMESILLSSPSLQTSLASILRFWLGSGVLSSTLQFNSLPVTSLLYFGLDSKLLSATEQAKQGSLGIAWNAGGPVSAVWGWVLAAVMTMSVGLSMAEIVSAFPNAGGPYFWASVLAGKHGPFFSWITGWFNLVGQVAITSSIVFSLATHLTSMLLLATGGYGTGIELSDAQFLGVYTAILVISGIMNAFNTRIVAWLSGFSVVWHFASLVVIIIMIPAVAPSHQSTSFVFGTFYDASQTKTGITSDAYLFLVGMLMSQYTITGYDASAHLAEETKGADIACSWAILMAIGASAVAGWAMLLALLFSIQDPTTLNDGSAGGYVAGQIFYDVFHKRFGSGGGGVVALIIPGVAMLLCGMASLTSNSRMIFGFARDRGLPISCVAKISPYTGTPVWAIIFSLASAFLLGLPLLNSCVAYSAVVSISTIGLYISYAIPICCRLTFSRTSFERGPFHLGSFSEPVGWIAVFWVAFITAVFVLPTSYPVTPSTLNYSGVAVGILLICVVAWWWSPIWGAREWYNGAKGMRMKPRGSPTKQALLPSPSQRHLEIDNNQCRQSMVSPETTMRRDSHDDDS